jgi:hypothetical protein
LSEFDVFEVALAHLSDGFLNFVSREFEGWRRPVVEFARQFAHGSVLVLFDVGENLLDGLADLGISCLDRGRVHSTLEIPGHVLLPFMASSASRAFYCKRLQIGRRAVLSWIISCGMARAHHLRPQSSALRFRAGTAVFFNLDSATRAASSHQKSRAEARPGRCARARPAHKSVTASHVGQKATSSTICGMSACAQYQTPPRTSLAQNQEPGGTRGASA